MKEKDILQNILTLSKSLINLYIQGEIESTNKNTKKIFHNNLEKSIELQYELFKEMENNQYYKLNNIDSNIIKNLYTKLKMTC